MPPSKMSKEPQWPLPHAWGHQLGTIGQQMITKPFFHKESCLPPLQVSLLEPHTHTHPNRSDHLPQFVG